MKLKYILLSGLLMVGLASCNDNDDPTPDPSASTSTLNIALRASGAASSSSAIDPNELEGEAALNNLSVFVFNEDGTELLGSKYVTLTNTSHSTEMTQIPAKSQKAEIMVVANIPQTVFNAISSLTDLREQILLLTSQSQSNLTMSSYLIKTTNALEQGDNYIGYSDQTCINDIKSPIVLTRDVARVDVQNMYTKFKGTDKEGRIVTVNWAYLKNVKTQSSYFSDDDWGIIELPGNEIDLDTAAIATAITDTTKLATVAYRTYAMENFAGADEPTQILINATISAGGGYKAQTKTFLATINPPATNKDVNHDYVKRNYVYKLTISFSSKSFDPEKIDETDPNPEEPYEPDPDGPGQPGEPDKPIYDTTTLDVNVQVVAWGPVNQSEVID